MQQCLNSGGQSANLVSTTCPDFRVLAGLWMVLSLYLMSFLHILYVLEISISHLNQVFSNDDVSH